jgi:hypothetical protein
MTTTDVAVEASLFPHPCLDGEGTDDDDGRGEEVSPGQIEREIGLYLFLYEIWWLNSPTQIIWTNYFALDYEFYRCQRFNTNQ